MRILASEVMVAVCHQTSTRTPLEAQPPGDNFAALLAATRSEASDEAPLSQIRALLAELLDRLRSLLGLAAEDLRRVEAQTEISTIQAQGRVQTADGRSLGFRMDLSLSRQSRPERDAALKDPLVLTFDGPSAALSGSRWTFDLDGDGRTETLPGLSQGCGVLVFDQNGNGKADDGRELFGASNGNGFQDLRNLDSDGNGWIDEGDPAFRQLAVWHPGDGSPLRSLADLGVGALWTGAADSPFDLGEGRLRATGLFLREDGRPGPLQQVDLRTT